MRKKNSDKQDNNIKIIQALYGIGQFVEKIEHPVDDYLIYIFDDKYNIVKIYENLDLYL